MDSLQKNQFQSEGYLILPGFLSEPELDELSLMIDELLDGQLKPQTADDGTIPDEFYTFWEPGLEESTLPRRERVRLMSYMAFHHPYFWQFARHPAIYSVLSELFEDSIQLYFDTLFMKPAHHGIEAELHQDTAFWGKLEPNAILYWMAIDPATIENGCLHVIPGSHNEDLSHTEDPVQRWVLREDQVDIARQVPIELSPGDVIFFDSGLVHRSYPNKSDQSRRAMTAAYVSSRVKHVTPWESKYAFKPITEPVSKWESNPTSTP